MRSLSSSLLRRRRFPSPLPLPSLRYVSVKLQIHVLRFRREWAAPAPRTTDTAPWGWRCSKAAAISVDRRRSSMAVAECEDGSLDSLMPTARVRDGAGLP
ncbi:hypothetical protein SEVIR_1G191600v4 [Setaria viridis]|uniref:Uncharacterized protein n=2 Tax=Setaria TaxID=4554 RepID=A0A368PMT4_SETIT|nr:hypothetical protein SETIT_1G187500v2 [Setaria italica]TKW39626.1 hypothetical protein SEVIR_1G191600v2 [Setaria viridis]